RAAAVPLGKRWLRRGAIPGLPHPAGKRATGVAAVARRRHPDRRRPAIHLDRVAGLAALSIWTEYRRTARASAVHRDRGRQSGGQGVTVTASVLLVASYALVLVAIAWGIDLMARRSSMRAARWRTGSFVYHADHDAWVCPQAQWLWPTSFDPQN